MISTAYFENYTIFCTTDLSAFYFDIRKDCLYCDPPNSLKRRGAQTVLSNIFEYLTIWLAPILCFTAEEAWLQRHPGVDQSVHLQTFPTVPQIWQNKQIENKWYHIRQVRRVVLGALELERAEKRIGSSLQAAPKVFVEPKFLPFLKDVDLAEIAITSAIKVEYGPAPAHAFRQEEFNGIGVVTEKANGVKCERCWKVLHEVGEDPELVDICIRCTDAVRLHNRSTVKN